MVERWDMVEALVIKVYRSGAASPADETGWQETVAWLREYHPPWAASIEPYWRAVTIKGVGPVAEDPFAGFLQIDSAATFINNWEAMRSLPAIRQATNEWLLDVIGGRM
jgi:hypothetical protein